MNMKTALATLGASAVASVIAIGTVVINAAAQAPPVLPTASASATAAPTNPSGSQTTPAPSGGAESGAHGGWDGPGGGKRGFGPEGFGGPGPGKDGFTVDGANRQITNATSFLTLAKSDLTYATGKMDTTSIQNWLTSADTLLKDAQTAVTATKYERASEDAQAASGLASAAESQMAQALGADKLPSASQRPQGRLGHIPNDPATANASITQAQASRVLANTYNQLVAQKALIKSADATPYLVEAQKAYQSAYTAYGAGKYSDAVSSAKLAEQLSGVARSVQAAADATDSPNTAVPVPAPNF